MNTTTKIEIAQLCNVCAAAMIVNARRKFQQAALACLLLSALLALRMWMSLSRGHSMFASVEFAGQDFLGDYFWWSFPTLAIALCLVAYTILIAPLQGRILRATGLDHLEQLKAWQRFKTDRVFAQQVGEYASLSPSMVTALIKFKQTGFNPGAGD